MKGLSKRQQETFSFIKEFIQQKGYSPSYREIQDHFDFSSLGTVYSLVKTLQRKGAIEMEEKSSRSFSLPASTNTQKSDQDVVIPFIGYIAAGFPIETFPNVQTVTLPLSLVHDPDHTYVLRAIGDTLNEELIGDGDLLIIEARQDAHSGEVVVGTINQHDTFVKRYFPEGDHVRLEGKNPHFQSQLLAHEEIAIQGVLVGVLRQY